MNISEAIIRTRLVAHNSKSLKDKDALNVLIASHDEMESYQTKANKVHLDCMGEIEQLKKKLKQETHAKEEVLKWYEDACEELDGGKQVAVDEMIIGKKEWETMTEAQQSYVKGWNACQRKYGTPKQEVELKVKSIQKGVPSLCDEVEQEVDENGQ